MDDKNKIQDLTKGLNLTSAFKKYNKTFDITKGLDLTSAFEKYNKTSDITKGLDLTSAFEKYNNTFNITKGLDLTSVFEKYNKTFNIMKGLDLTSAFEKQNKSLDQIKAIDWPNFEYVKSCYFNNLSLVIDSAAEEYLSDNDIKNTEDKDEILDFADNLLGSNPCVKDLSPKQKVFFVTFVYPIIIIFIQIFIEFIILKPSIINNNNTSNVNNYISTVNNYYIQEGFSKDFLNDNNLRIISDKNSIIREKNDCSSKIISKLQIGKVVCVIDKYKKWVKVSWYGEEGGYYCGWIQNYKLTYFK